MRYFYLGDQGHIKGSLYQVLEVYRWRLNFTQAAVAAGPAAPLVEAGAGTLGYAAGKQLGTIMEKFGEEKPIPSAGEMATQAVTEDLPLGAVGAMAGPAAAKPIGWTIDQLSKGAAFVIKPIWGRLMGLGKPGVEESVRSGKEAAVLPGTPRNPLRSATDFDRALRGDISQQDVANNALAAMRLIREARGKAYVRDLEKIMANPAFLNQVANRVQSKVHSLLTSDDFGPIAVTQAAAGEPLAVDLSKSVIVENQGPVIKTIQDVLTSQDTTVKGLDVLKKRLSSYIDQTNRLMAMTRPTWDWAATRTA